MRQKSCALRECNFRAMCRKSLCKSTENEEAGKVQSCADVRKYAQYLYKSTENCRKLMEKTHGNVLKTHGSALYLINNAREVRYFCVKMVKNDRKYGQNMCRIYIKCVESMCILYKKQCKRCSKKYAEREIILHYCTK